MTRDPSIDRAQTMVNIPRVAINITNVSFGSNWRTSFSFFWSYSVSKILQQKLSLLYRPSGIYPITCGHVNTSVVSIPTKCVDVIALNLLIII